jgi:hypothetical protein
MLGAVPVAMVAAVTVVTACGGSSVQVARTHATTPTPTPTPAAASCPTPTGSSTGYAAIDYVDFVQAFGHQYVAGIFDRRAGHITRADLGTVVLTSRCAFSAYNDRTHQSPGEPRDGDTGFLPPGTPIHAVDGWSPQCRLAAELDGTLHVYLATKDSATKVTPRNCALHH